MTALTLAELDQTIIAPALLLLPERMTSKPARIELLAISGQESAREFRRQIGGPARGLWQFEAGGGVRGVLNHPASKPHAAALCKARGVPSNEASVYGALEHDDILAAGFARLLLWTDAYALPQNDPDAGWDYYVRTWRPGKPHKQKWPALYMQAVDYVLRGDTGK